jgi:hypothetical protein
MDINIQTDIELDEADIEKMKSFAYNLANKKKAKQKPEVPQEKRIYVLNILDTDYAIMVSKCGDNSYIIKGKKEAEYICRQLEKAKGHKFYIEECEKPKNYKRKSTI